MTGRPRVRVSSCWPTRLKKRIDPADLYNITIRPVSNTRVEIILPTGAKRQAEAAQANWDKLLDEAKEQWPPKVYKAH